jgi:hypothetical protein
VCSSDLHEQHRGDGERQPTSGLHLARGRDRKQRPEPERRDPRELRRVQLMRRRCNRGREREAERQRRAPAAGTRRTVSASPPRSDRTPADRDRRATSHRAAAPRIQRRDRELRATAKDRRRAEHPKPAIEGQHARRNRGLRLASALRRPQRRRIDDLERAAPALIGRLRELDGEARVEDAVDVGVIGPVAVSTGYTHWFPACNGNQSGSMADAAVDPRAIANTTTHASVALHSGTRSRSIRNARSPF